MTALFKRFGFAATVVILVLAMGVVVAGKSLLAPKEDAGAGPSQVAKGPDGAKGKGKKGQDAPAVVAGIVAPLPFYDVVQAIGTAQAKESITISAKVTDVIRAIRFDSGDRVAKGQVLVELSNVEQSADLLEARASAESAARDWDRFKELGEKGFASRQRVEAARAALDQANARVSAMQSRIGDRTIRAPFAGVIGLRSASPGALVRPGDPIATLDDISEIKLDFEIAESQIAKAVVGAPIVARTTAIAGRAFSGRIADVDTRLNPQSRTLKVRAIIPNADRALKPGMLMSVEIRSNPRVALAAPEIAVLERSDGSYLYVLAERDGKSVVAPTLIQTGRRGGGLVEIVSGVQDGAKIVVEGVQRARPGQPVKIVETRPALEATPSPAAAPAGLRGTAPSAAPPAIAREKTLPRQAATAPANAPPPPPAPAAESSPAPAASEKAPVGAGGQTPNTPAD